ncbi:MAG: hypothetical protein ACLVHQ_02435 [Oscillospiraceae bacterium]
MIVHIACMEQFYKLTYDITEDMKSWQRPSGPASTMVVWPERSTECYGG